MIVINLIPRRHREAIAVRVRIRRWIAATGVLAVCVGAGCGILRAVGRAQTSRLDGDVGQLASRVESARQTLDKVRKDVQELSRRLEASETVGVHPDWSTFLGVLAQARGDDIVLQGVEIQAVDPPQAPPSDSKSSTAGKSVPPARHIETYLVTMRGFGLSQSDVLAFVTRLEELAPLEQVRLGEARTAPFRGVQAVAFDAECRLVERPAAEAAVGGVP